MIFNQTRVVGVCLFLIAISFVFVSLPIYATSRGIIVQAKTRSGSPQKIKLYSGYHALVVGSSDYRAGWPKLPNPVNDAREIAITLKEMGWEVDLLEDPDWDRLDNALNKLITGPGKVKDKGVLFWFSGHGHTLEEADGTKLGYIVPVDAPLPTQDETQFMRRAIDMRQIETVAKRIRAKHVLMVFDSCFSGAIFTMVRAAPSEYIEEKIAAPVRQFITAGRENEQVPDRSVFKICFIQGIKDGYADFNRDGYVTGEELGSYLQETVINYSHKAQHPQYGKINNPKLDKGDFVFVLKRSVQFSQYDTAESEAEAAKRDLLAEADRSEQERGQLEQLKAHTDQKKKQEIPVLPKVPTALVVVSGDENVIPLFQAHLEGSMIDSGLKVISIAEIPVLMEKAQYGNLPMTWYNIKQFVPKHKANILLLAKMHRAGSMRLKYYGRMQELTTVTYSVRAFDMVSGQTITSPATGTVKFTPLNMEENIKSEIDTAAGSMGSNIMKYWQDEIKRLNKKS
jgi:hypothetical protein